MISPTTSAQATSAWTSSNIYVQNNANGNNVTFQGYKVNATNGFYETSDANLKNFESDICVDLDILSKIPKKYFTWKNDEEKKPQIGTSAQYLLGIYPELVSEDSEGYLTVDYAKLSIVALAAIDELHKENLDLKERLRRIEEKLGL